MKIPNAMFMNGPKAGQVITLPEIITEKVTVGTMVNLCSHRPESENPILMIEYSVSETMRGGLYALVTEDKTIGSAYYCMECKADSEAKYKLRKIRDQLNEALGEDDH